MSQHEANIGAKIDQKSIQNWLKICLKFAWILEYLGGGPGALITRHFGGKRFVLEGLLQPNQIAEEYQTLRLQANNLQN